jgi:hypothetical protein
MKIRLLTTYTGGSTDGYYILWKPGQSGEELFTAKAAKDTAAATNKVVLEKTITKSYTASTFAIPEFWICNTGSTAPDLTTHKITYGDVGTVTMFWVFSLGNNRGGTNETNGMVTRVYGSSTSTSISKKATNGSVSKPSIKQDAGKNTFTISGTITAQNLAIGDMVAAGTVLSTVSNEEVFESKVGKAFTKFIDNKVINKRINNYTNKIAK